MNYPTLIALAAFLQIVFAGEIFWKIQCQHSNLTITCPRGTTINVTKGFYGRDWFWHCHEVNSPAVSVDCTAPNADNVIKERCNLRQTCTFLSDDITFGQNSCANNVRKYTEVRYECVQRDISTKFHCHHDDSSKQLLNLKCPKEHHLWITNAWFGRRHPAICNNFVKDIRTHDCYSNVAPIIQNKCDNRDVCKTYITVPTDQCAGTTSKYLEVDYLCLNPINNSPVRIGTELTVSSVIITERVCESNSLELKCPIGKYLWIRNAIYGRKSEDICPSSGYDTNTNCTAAKALCIMQKRCNYRRICMVEANNKIFGDPCIGTFKYLEVDYQCLKVEDPEILNQYPKLAQVDKNGLVLATDLELKLSDGKIFTKIACQRTNLKLSCPRGTTIKILSGFYGKRNAAYCYAQGFIDDEKCEAYGAFNVIKKECNHKQTCSLFSNDGTFGTRICPDVNKYTEVTYECQKDKINSKIACEYSKLEIGCPSGQVLWIINAWYGRRYSDVCEPEDRKNKPLLIYECNADSAFSIVQNRCNNEQSCSVNADNSIFGDPCNRTYKYLEVDYQCLKAGSLPNSTKKDGNYAECPK